MRTYTKIKILLTVLLAILVAYFCVTYLKSLSDDTTVVIAAQDVDEHVIITKGMLKEVKISRRDKLSLEKDSVSTIKELEGGITKNKILKGSTFNRTDDVILGTKEELINKKVLNSSGEINNGYFLADSKRVETVRVDSQGAVGNKLNIGDWVDVIYTSTNDISVSFSNIILSHIKVTDIEKLKDKNGDSSQNISLLVSPQQAIDLSFAKRNGKIDLVLAPETSQSETIYPTGIKKFISDSNTRQTSK